MKLTRFLPHISTNPAKKFKQTNSFFVILEKNYKLQDAGEKT